MALRALANLTLKSQGFAMSFLARNSAILLTTISLGVGTAAADWPQFRGPGGTGCCPDQQVLTEWSDDDAIAYCLDTKTGDVAYRERIPGTSGGGRGKPFYASTVLVGDHLYAVSRTGATYVLASGSAFAVVSHNKIESDTSQFNGTPAVSKGQLFLRSDRFLYCLGEEK